MDERDLSSPLDAELESLGADWRAAERSSDAALDQIAQAVATRASLTSGGSGGAVGSGGKVALAAAGTASILALAMSLGGADRDLADPSAMNRAPVATVAPSESPPVRPPAVANGPEATEIQPLSQGADGDDATEAAVSVGDSADVENSPPEEPVPMERAVRPRREDHSKKSDPAGGSSMRAELELMERARAALRGGEPKVAVEKLKEHARRFPSGLLARERDGSLVTALCAAGREARAMAAAQKFVKRYGAGAGAMEPENPCRDSKEK